MKSNGDMERSEDIRREKEIGDYPSRLRTSEKRKKERKLQSLLDLSGGNGDPIRILLLLLIGVLTGFLVMFDW